MGARHTKFASRGFTPGLWRVFKEACESVIEHRCETSQNVWAKLSSAEKAQLQSLWSALAAVLAQQMYQGFTQALMEKQTSSHLSSQPQPINTEQSHVLIQQQQQLINKPAEVEMGKKQPAAAIPVAKTIVLSADNPFAQVCLVLFSKFLLSHQ